MLFLFHSSGKKIVSYEEENVNRKSLEECLEMSGEGNPVSVCDRHHSPRPGFLVLEVKEKLYMVKEKTQKNRNLIDRYAARGNIVEGHVNLMKYKGREIWI